MNIEQLVTSRPLSERLRDLGVPQNRTAHWWARYIHMDDESGEWYVRSYLSGTAGNVEQGADCPTTDELLERLKDIGYSPCTGLLPFMATASAVANNPGTSPVFECVKADRPAEALGELYAKLLTEGVVTP